MKNKNIPSNTELPSLKKLVKSTILAIFLAAIILITVVLPAEYSLDPTGIGRVIGLLKMGQIKVSLAQEAAADRVLASLQQSEEVDNSKQSSESVTEVIPPPSNENTRSDKMTFSLSPNEGKEIKLTMRKGEQVNYIWTTNGGKANFDAHADSKKLQISYHNYDKGSQERKEGVLEAAFDGKHGWFWRNRTSKTMKITLQVNGEYSDVVQM